MKLNDIFENVGSAITSHSSELLLGAGILSIGFGIFGFCKSTIKMESIIDDHKEVVDTLKDIHVENITIDTKENNGANIVALDKAYKSALTKTYISTGFSLAKNYALPTALVLFGTGCIIGSYDIVSTKNKELLKQNTGLLAANAALTKSYNGYRTAVKEELGAEADERFAYGVKSREVKETVVDENGKKKTLTKTENYVPENYRDIPVNSPYAIWFDETCAAWERDDQANTDFFNSLQRFSSVKLREEGHLYLNEARTALDRKFYDPVMGNEVGWFETDSVIYDIHKFKKEDPLAELGYSYVYLIDFNCEGNIIEKLRKIQDNQKNLDILESERLVLG